MSESKFRVVAEDTVVLFADLQTGIVELTKTVSLERLKKGVNGLAKLAKQLQIPAFVTGVMGEDGSPAKVIAEIGDNLGPLPTYHRTTCDSFLNEEIVKVVKATGRKTLLVSGVATELAVQLAALTAAEMGYKVLVVVDACGGISERTEQAALQRMAKAGATTVSVMTLAGELAGDLRQPAAQPLLGIVYEMAMG
jgi:isochorismate hydrolase